MIATFKQYGTNAARNVAKRQVIRFAVLVIDLPVTRW